MKSSLVLAALVLSVGSQAQANGNWIIGGIVEAEKNIYEGGKDEAELIPYLAYETDRLHVGIDGVDYELFDTGTISLDANLDYRFAPGFPDSALFEGLERDDALELGLSATYSFGELYVDASVAGDVSDAHNGFEGELALGYEASLGNVLLDAKAGIKFKDENLNNYLYGVSESEANNARAAFEMSNTANAFASLTAAYALTDTTYLIGELSYEDLGEASDSPLVAETRKVDLVIGLGWQF